MWGFSGVLLCSFSNIKCLYATERQASKSAGADFFTPHINPAFVMMVLRVLHSILRLKKMYMLFSNCVGK